MDDIDTRAGPQAPASNALEKLPPMELLAAEAPPAENEISDGRFLQELENLKRLCTFIRQEAVYISPENAPILMLGELNLLHGPSLRARSGLAAEGGRPPTMDEWSQLEGRSQKLFALMDEARRRKFAMGDTPWVIAWLPMFLAPVALLSLIVAVWNPEVAFDAYLVWLLSLGSIGSVAFIGMNALSVQQDITFDLTNRRLMLLRIALGALFGLVLTLPFGFESFLDFIKGINSPGARLAPGAQQISIQAILLLMPFIFGFSTTLVILVLNQAMEAVQVFFGKKGAAGDRQDAAQTKSSQ
jgi:hypothetical protein